VPDQVGEAQDAIANQLRVLDDIGSVTDNAGKDQLAVRQFDALPHFPFVLVGDIASLERIRPGVWKRMRSCGRPFKAWFSASISTIVNLR
jgi:hypothetical protein